MCNNFVYSRLIIGDMHETMIRLYQAAKSVGVTGKSNVASKMGQSPQTLNNWEARGMSKGGMLIAQRVFGCSSVWLETGRDGTSPPMQTIQPEDVIEGAKWIMAHGEDRDKEILANMIDSIRVQIKPNEQRTQELPPIRDRRKRA